MSRTNEARHIEWHETCKCNRKLDPSVCNNKQRWNEDKFRCESKGLIDKGVCDEVFIWNTSNCECECDQFCDIAEYLDYENCECTKKFVDKLIEECTENVKEEKITEMTFCENENKHKCSSCTLYVVLYSIVFTINVEIGTYFTYFYWYLKKDIPRVEFNTSTQTTI